MMVNSDDNILAITTKPSIRNSPSLTPKDFNNNKAKRNSMHLKNHHHSITLSLSSASSSTTTKTTATSKSSSLSSSLISLNNNHSSSSSSSESDQTQRTDLSLLAPYKGKQYYGKDWLFKKLHEYVINKVYDKPFFLILIGDSGNGKTHLCCEIKWPTDTSSNSCLTELNRRVLSIYFLNLYNLTQNSYYKNLTKLYSHLKNTILNNLNIQQSTPVTTTTTTTSTSGNSSGDDDDEDGEEVDEEFLKNNSNEDYDDFIVNKYVNKFHENVLVYLNKQDKQTCNYYILIDGVDELLLYDQYLTKHQNANKTKTSAAKDDFDANKNFNLILKFLNRIFLKFPKWLHLIITCKRLTEKQYIRNRYFENIKNYFKLSIDMCVTMNNQYLNLINEKIEQQQQQHDMTNVKSSYSLMSCLSQNTATIASASVNNPRKETTGLLSSNLSTTSSSSPSTIASTTSRSSSSSFDEKIKQPESKKSDSYSTATTTVVLSPPSTLSKLTSAEILNAAHFASLKDIQIYILKRLDNDNELKLKFNKLNAIEMLNLLLIKSNNCLLYVEKILDLILLNIINSREIRDIPVTIYGLYMFLIERLLVDLNSTDTQQAQQPLIKQLIYSVFNLFIVELKPVNKLKLFLKLKLKYTNLDYNYFEYVFNSIASVLFTRIQNDTQQQNDEEYIIFHSSLIEWFSDVKFCTQKYLFNLNEGNYMLTLFYFNKFKKQDHLNERHQLNYSEHKRLLKLFKRFQFHLMNANTMFTCNEFNYLMNLCESTSSLLLNYELINELLFNNKKFLNDEVATVATTTVNTAQLSSLSSFSNNDDDDRNFDSHLMTFNNDNVTLSNSNYSIRKLNMCDSGLGLSADVHVNYQTFLFNFVRNGDLSGVKALISKGVDPETTDALNQTALILAAKLNNYEIIDCLCKIPGLNLNHCDNEGWTALRYCSWIGNEKAVKRLLESHAVVDASDAEGRTALRAAVYGNHENIMKYLIKYGACVTKCDNDGRSILQIACYKGHWNIVSYLAKFETLINHKDYVGRNALFTAIYLENKTLTVDIMKLLLSNRCDVNEPDNSNQTVLIVAVQERLVEVVQLMIAHGADVDAIDNLGYTAVAYAIRNKDAELVDYLLNHNAATHILDLEGRSILSLACSNNCQEAVRLLMLRGLDEMHKDNFGWTPLHEASYAGSEMIVEMLLQYGSDINDVDNENKSALYYACQEGHFEVMRTLVDNNADFNQQSHDGNSPLRIACLQGHKHVCEFLISRNCDINLVDTDGRSTLYCLILLGRNTDMMEFLLQNGANSNQKDTNGRSCLHIAAHIGNMYAITLLMKYNADLEAVDSGGRTPLLTSSWGDNLPAVKQLLELGADVNHQDQQGATALSIASQKGNYNIVLELLTHDALIFASSKSPIQLAIKGGFHEIAKLLENWSITTGQKPTHVPRTSKSLDSFRIHSQATERRILATLNATPSPSKKEKQFIASHSMSYQVKPTTVIQNKAAAESYCEVRPAAEFANPGGNKKSSGSSFRNIFSKKNDRNSGIFSKNDKHGLINNPSIAETSTLSSEKTDKSSKYDSSQDSPKSKSSNNKFIQMIRKKFRFFTGSSNNEHINEKKRSMHRSVTDSIAHQTRQSKHIDDAAFIFNRASINDYFHQRSSLREYNISDNKGTTTATATNQATIVNQRIMSNIDENNCDINLIPGPTCLQLSYFKKETSI